MCHCVSAYWAETYTIITAFPPVWQSVCLPTSCPLPQNPTTPETCPTFRRASPHFPPSTSFILFLKPRRPPGNSVSGSEMCCEWSPHQTLDRPRNSHRYSAHTLRNIYFRCDFFSPLVPFLCLTYLPSLNQYGWVDNFTGSLTPKGPQRGRARLLAPLLIPSVAPLRRLSQLCSLRCFSHSDCTTAALQYPALVDTHWCMEHLYELVISYCSAHSSNSVCQTVPLPYSQTVCLSPPPSFSLSLSLLSLTHTHRYSIV